MRLTRTVMQPAGALRAMQRAFSAFAIAVVDVGARDGAILSGSACAAEQKGLLETIKRHSIVTSTVPANGDQNPYAIVVAPVTAGKIQKDDVLVDNFNDRNNLQGLGTTIVDYNPTTKKLQPVRGDPAQPGAMSRRRRPDHRDDHAQIRLGHRRQPAEPGRHHQHQGPGLPDRPQRPRQRRRHHRRAEHQRSLGQHGGDRQRRHRDAVRQQYRLRCRPARWRTAGGGEGDCAAH